MTVMVSHSASVQSASDTPSGRIFSSFVASFLATHDQLDDRERADYVRVTADLATTMLRSSDGDRSATPRSSDPMLVQIRAFIREHYRSPELTPDEVARAHFISRRKLYDVFAPLRTTPSAYIRAERLDLASKLLIDPLETMTIAGIARHCGFSDVTTFTRGFRVRFGVRPGEWRIDQSQPSAA